MQPLIHLSGITRSYPSGEGELQVLHGIDLTIAQGEFVAIIGASGSGKSTLMNILGCLDQPSSGSYLLDGREVAELDSGDLAALRREFFGFVFQRYHLLNEMTALGNVEVPAIYRGVPSAQRRDKAAALLGRLGMGARLDHRPGQLSGGQQQRVSIARALVNDARVILADEPTGALDSQSGEEVLSILDELNAEGRTVIIVTHDPKVAARARRVVEIADGRIVSDRSQEAPAPATATADSTVRAATPGIGRLAEALRMAVLAMRAHKLRSFLTMLGIIIGIASVVSVVALGEGSRQQVLANISGLGTNTLQVFPGQNFGDTRSGKVTTLVLEDGTQLARQSYVASVSPTVSTSQTLRHGATEASAQISGVGEQYFDVAGITLTAGRAFDAADIAAMSQDVVIDENTRASLFPDQDPLGQTFMAGKVPLRVVGVAAARQKWLSDLQELDLIADSAIRLVREEVGADEREPLRLDLLLAEIAEELRGLGQHVELAPPPAIEVSAGPIALKRALRNLMTNAATHGRGALVSLTREGDRALIRILDDGPGVPEELLSQVFEPFFRVDQARRKTVPGAGLGLAIAREIIERHQGSIEIRNRRPRGLEQVCTLPCLMP